MKKVSLLVLMFVPFVANAAGTYYTGTYQSPQSSYASQTYAGRQSGYSSQYSRYSTPSYNTSRYTSPYSNTANVVAQPQQATGVQQQSGKSGFWLNAGITHEIGQWQFEMAESGSILSYDNLAWNVFDLSAGYAFDLGKTTLQVDAGFKYGIQWGETRMVDDDISNGGFLVTTWIEAGTENEIGQQIGHAMSVGTSKGGNMMGFNFGFGLTDMFQIGGVKFTPSVGFRYLKYKLETENNYGLSVDTTACFEVNGEVQCDPAIIVHLADGGQQIIWREDINEPMRIPDNAEWVDTGSTYYYQQPGTSHSYETTWMGPYLALDMVYDINQNNSVNGRIELGLPGYKSVGDQPYRFDWQHPKSVEDEAGMFGAFHLGLLANWTTALSDYVALSIGITYDYYTVSGADAKTYLDGNYYTDWYNQILNDDFGGDETAMLDPDNGSATAINIKDLEESCPGWVCSTNGEIDSFYKSMGVRVGINAKF